MGDSDSDPDVSKLAREVIGELDSGRYGDKFVFSRRQVIALAGAGLSVGALTTLGVDEATAQEAVGQVGTEDEPIDVEAASVNAGSVSTESADVTNQMSAGSVSTGDTESDRIVENESPEVKTWTQDGSNVDTRLSNALSGATGGNRLMLENGTYTSNHTVENTLDIIGGGGGANTVFEGVLSFDRVFSSIRSVRIAGTLELGTLNYATRIDLGSATISVQGDRCVLAMINNSSGQIVFEDGTSGGSVGIVESGVTITDNGNNEVLGS